MGTLVSYCFGSPEVHTTTIHLSPTLSRMGQSPQIIKVSSPIPIPGRNGEQSRATYNIVIHQGNWMNGTRRWRDSLDRRYTFNRGYDSD